MRSFLIIFLGKLFEAGNNLYRSYQNRKINRLLGGGNRIICYPFIIKGIKNIIAADDISIGSGATLYTTRAKIIINKQFVSGPNLTIITGDHMPRIGCFLKTVSDTDKDEYDVKKNFDKDVVIEEDVWCGANVTILKGVKIGRGAIIAAGAVVVKDIPPYCVAAGVPANPIKSRWNVEEILEHESILYPESERFSKTQIESFSVF